MVFLRCRNPIRFSLRTLLVLVTLASLTLGWIGYYWNWARERREYLVSERCNAFLWPGDAFADRIRPLPLGLRLIGERPLLVVAVRPDCPEDIVRVAQLFPETTIQIGELNIDALTNLPPSAE